MSIDSARVSAEGQLLDRQIRALTDAGCSRIFSDKKSGKNAEREKLWRPLTTCGPATLSSSRFLHHFEGRVIRALSPCRAGSVVRPVLYEL